MLAVAAAPLVFKAARPLARRIGKGLRKLGEQIEEAAVRDKEPSEAGRPPAAGDGQEGAVTDDASGEAAPEQAAPEQAAPEQAVPISDAPGAARPNPEAHVPNRPENGGKAKSRRKSGSRASRKAAAKHKAPAGDGAADPFGGIETA
jgi:hypothetical protein